MRKTQVLRIDICILALNLGLVCYIFINIDFYLYSYDYAKIASILENCIPILPHTSSE